MASRSLIHRSYCAGNYEHEHDKGDPTTRCPLPFLLAAHWLDLTGANCCVDGQLAAIHQKIADWSKSPVEPGGGKAFEGDLMISAIWCAPGHTPGQRLA